MWPTDSVDHQRFPIDDWDQAIICKEFFSICHGYDACDGGDGGGDDGDDGYGEAPLVVQ